MTSTNDVIKGIS